MNFSRIGAVLAAVGVALGAFGAHGLQGRIEPELLEIFKTSTYYLMIHSLALLIFGMSRPIKRWPGWCFLLGIGFFSGSLYGILLTGIRMLGAITPIGGVLFIVGWLGFSVQLKSDSARAS
jgi:uncharacterized membrane protein YgdD (TMEM256/DUF423 family)